MDSEVKTLASLPFHISDRLSKPVLFQRCRATGADDFSSQELFEEIRVISLGLSALGVQPGDRVALISDTRPEWVIADLAILSAGAVTVPLYPTLASEQIFEILNDAKVRFAIVAGEAEAAKVRSVLQTLPQLEIVAVIDRQSDETSRDESGEIGLCDVAERGRRRLLAEEGLAQRYRETVNGVSPNDIATIIYTSGTTGRSKGVMLTHVNILSNVRASLQMISMKSDDVALSFLPLSHSLERTVVYAYLCEGVTVAFAESLETIARDLRMIKPTIMTGVPRVYEKVQARVLESVAQAPAIRRKIFGWAISAGWSRASRQFANQSVPWYIRFQNLLADRMVFRKIRARTGGRLRLIVSGGAPLGISTAEFFCAIGMPIVEGYGLTETAPVLTLNPPEAVRIGTVGKAIPGVDLKVAPDGELLARGPNVMQGYYGKPDATAEVIRDGWFHTGDIGNIDDDGYVSVTDRKKDILVTSNGKNIAPQPIEARFKRSPLVAEALLLGDRRRFIAVLLIPDRAQLEELVLRDGASFIPIEDLVERADVQLLYQEVVDEVNVTLAGFEQVRRFKLLPAEFSIAGGELTPTMKVRRRVVEERWNKVIEMLYAESLSD